MTVIGAFGRYRRCLKVRSFVEQPRLSPVNHDTITPEIEVTELVPKTDANLLRLATG
jgi:hypothetical protein